MLNIRFTDKELECGCDEAGRGCLAGPVVAAAVILPLNWSNKIINDSKKLSEKQRNHLRKIIEQEALAWSVAMVDHGTIDKINILQASIKAMHLAIDGLHVAPEYLIIDGNRFQPYKDIPYSTIVKGDGKYASIAAASILAKTHRDELMETLDKEFPAYLWNKNKGYPTKEHRDAIEKCGISEYHRKTFRQLKAVVRIDKQL